MPEDFTDHVEVAGQTVQIGRRRMPEIMEAHMG
jgi:hypothetical protein